jgi:hypothetical protein
LTIRGGECCIIRQKRVHSAVERHSVSRYFFIAVTVPEYTGSLSRIEP